MGIYCTHPTIKVSNKELNDYVIFDSLYNRNWNANNNDFGIYTDTMWQLVGGLMGFNDQVRNNIIPQNRIQTLREYFLSVFHFLVIEAWKILSKQQNKYDRKSIKYDYLSKLALE